MKGWCGVTSWESPPEQPYLQAARPASAHAAATLPCFPGRLRAAAWDSWPVLAPKQPTPARGRWEPAAATCLPLLHHLAAQLDVLPFSLLSRSFILSALPLLLHQVRLARCAASQDAEAPRPAAKRGFTHKAAKRGDGRTNLKHASRKARGWGIYGMRNKEARAVEGRGAWGEVIGKRCGTEVLRRRN